MDVVNKRSKEVHANAAYFKGDRKELSERYPGEFVAIHQHGVVAHDKDWDKLKSKLKAEGICREPIHIGDTRNYLD